MAVTYARCVMWSEILPKGPPPKCTECDDVYLTNPDSRKDGVCRECKGKVGMGKMSKGFRYQ